MKYLPLLAAIAGVAVMVGLVGYFGAGGVFDSLLSVGIAGFASICLIHLCLIVVMGMAWRMLVPHARALPFAWGRLMRDSGSEVLPLSQVGGYVLGARALSLCGVSGTVAAASTIVDVTLEFVAQLAYTALGLAWLVYHQPQTDAAGPALVGLAIAGIAAVAFFLMQRHGLVYIDRLARILGEGWAERTASGAASLHAALAAIYRNPVGLAVSFVLHLGCWIASAVEAWLALWLAGAQLDFTAVLAIESLLYAIRTMAFFVPNAVGVQEGAYILLGGSFGLTPDMMLALSLLKRARDLAIGLPPLGLWQIIEGGRLWRRVGARKRDSAAASAQVSTVPVRTRP